MAYRLALFDFDGVLADSAAWFIAQLPELAQRHRFRAPDASEIERLRKLPTGEIGPWLRRPGAADCRAAGFGLVEPFSVIVSCLHAARFSTLQAERDYSAGRSVDDLTQVVGPKIIGDDSVDGQNSVTYGPAAFLGR